MFVNQKDTICPSCHKSYLDSLPDVEAIESLGECLSCDHIRGEYFDDMKAEMPLDDDME